MAVELLGGIGTGRGGGATTLAGRRASATAFTALGQNATIAAETTAAARTIWQVRHYDGNVFLGYGDYDANTGPCDLIYWDGDSFEVAASALATDAIQALRVAAGELWVPYTDPRGADDYARVLGTDVTAVAKATPNPTHLYDAFAHTDGSLYLAGADVSNDNDPTIWRSDDDGATWTAVCSQDLADTVDARYHMVFFLGGFFWTQAPATGNARKSADGITWSDAGFRLVAAVTPTQRAALWGGKVWFRTGELNGGHVYGFDGTGLATAITITGRANIHRDLVAADGYLYVLTAGATYGSELWRTTDGASWARVATLAGDVLRSVDVHDGTAWAGGTDSRLYRATGLGTLGGATIWVDGRESQWVDADGDVWVV